MRWGDGFLFTTDVMFDPSIWHLLQPLSSGAVLHLVKRAQRTPDFIAKKLDSGEITHYATTPALLTRILSYCKSDLKSIKQLVCAGEAYPAKLYKMIQKNWPHIILVNLYGPAEAAIDVTVAKAGAHWESEVPIGYPASGCPLYRLDSNLNQVDTSQEGELYIGGIQPGWGYFSDPALTAIRFLPDPFSEVAGSRMYKTGDLTGLSSKGELLFKGRVDHQIKWRGVRIEPAGLESLLMEQRGVNLALVMMVDMEGEQVLVGFIEGDAKEDNLIQALRRELSESRIPARIYCLYEFPKNRSGKIDRTKLQSIIKEQKHVSEPQENQELIDSMIEIWKVLLDKKEIHARSHFFECGGYSILAIGLLREIKEKLGFKASIKMLWESPVLADFVSRLDHQNVSTDEKAGALVFVAPPGGLHDCYAGLVSDFSSDYRILYWSGKESVNALKEQLKSNKEVVLCGWSAGGLEAWNLACSLYDSGGTNIKVILLDTAFPHPTYEKMYPERGNITWELFAKLVARLFKEEYLPEMDPENFIDGIIKRTGIGAGMTPEELYQRYCNDHKRVGKLIAKNRDLPLFLYTTDSQLEDCLGWESFPRCKVFKSEGDHFSMIREHRETLVRSIREQL
jgi:thioesterase domain-containing protein